MSLWNETVEMPKFQQLDGDTETDILIIGGGMAGILCAYELKLRGAHCLLIDKGRIGSGTTSGTTAVITAQHGDIYSKLVKEAGREAAGSYLSANMNAFEKYRELAGVYDYDFTEKPSYIYSLTDKTSMQVEAAVLNELGADVVYTENTDLPFDIAGAVRFANAGQMHPLKLIAGLSNKLDIRENTLMSTIEGKSVITNRGVIKANKIIIASHFPPMKISGLFSLKMYQMRSYAAAVESSLDLHGTYADTAEGGIYLRKYRDMVIVGGGDMRTGSGKAGFDIIRNFICDNIPNAKERYVWAAQDCMSLDGIPYIGRLSAFSEDVYVVTGFNEWGMTTAMAAADIIADMIEEKHNPFVELFDPDRSILKKQLFINGAEAVKNLISPSMKRCTHLGCVLKKNDIEGTWECPCHGSRFDLEGKVLCGPAVKDKK